MRGIRYGMRVCGGIVILWLTLATASYAQVFVKTDAIGNNDGTSWNDAFTDLQNALALTSAGELWVAAATYLPTSGVDRTAAFQLKNGVSLYGGFAGTETALGERDVIANPTILSGEIGAPGIADNSYHVVTGSGTDGTALLDGFIVSGGNADGSGTDDDGAGMLNVGGSPTVNSVIFAGNSAFANGGAVANMSGSSPTLTNCLFEGNDGQNGGGVYNLTNSSPVLTNVTFYGNAAGSGGGGMLSVDASHPTVSNAIFYGNTALLGPQIRSILGSVPVIAYSLVEGSGGSGAGWDAALGADGGGNIDADPVFVDAAGGDFELHRSSPGIDAGNVGAPNLPATDLKGDPRIFGSTVDLGVFELHVFCPAGNVMYVDVSAIGTADGTSWGDAHTDIQEAFYTLTLCPGVTEFWVAAGTYSPTDGTDRTATFELASDVALYGGFVGTETARGQRNPSVNVTVLNGEIGSAASLTDNSYHVVTADSVTGTVLDGFTISGGWASSSGVLYGGGVFGVACSLTVANCTFEGNFASHGGGGLSVQDGGATLTNVVFLGNATSLFFGHGGAVRGWQSDLALTGATFDGNNGQLGGGLYTYFGSLTATGVIFRNNASFSGGGGYVWVTNALFVDAVFEGNTASSGVDGGGGLYRVGGTSTLDIVNAVFFNNSATVQGGGLHVRGNLATITNVSFAGNSADYGGGVYNATGTPTAMTNTILWGNTAATTGAQLFNGITAPTISFSLIENSGGSGAPWDTTLGTDGGNNIDADPLFADPPGGDLRLTATSPAINAGDNSAPNLPPTDLDGKSRVLGGAVDMGPYEFDAPTAFNDPIVPALPKGSVIRAVYPNPFNPTVTIEFDVDQARFVEVTIFDVRGKLVHRPFAGRRPAGTHRVQWDGRDGSGRSVASGVYIVRVRSEGWRDQKKVVLLK